MIGTHIGNYRIVSKLGGGAMGDVYCAEHSTIGRRAAVKVLKDSIALDPALLARFFDEARAVTEIRHPNIVDITDFGTVDGRHYIMMELLEGETLEARLSRTRAMGPEVAVSIAAQVASALGAAHEHSIVHRDLKPENLYITEHADYPDWVKVLDFGIAKLTGGMPQGRERTQVGMLLGTPAYMSPEQCRGAEELDHRSDIYSLGVVLYQMVVGRLPHDGGSIAELLAAHLHDEPVPPKKLVKSLPDALDAVIVKTMAKDPAQRFQDMRSLRQALDAIYRTPNKFRRETPVAAIVAAPRRAEGPAVDTNILRQIKNRPRPSKPAPKRRSKPVVDRLAVGTFSTGRVGEELARIILERVREGRLVLPAMPQTIAKTMELINNTDLSFADLAAVLETDPLLAPQILRVANSPAYMGSAKAVNLMQAIGRVGLQQLRVLMLEVSAHQLFQSRNRKIRRAFASLWDYSLAVASLSRELCKAVGGSIDPSTAYLAGLLHEVGRPVAATLLLEAEKHLPGAKQAWMNDSIWFGIVESCQRDVGAALARTWELSAEVVASIESLEYDLAFPCSCANVVRLASAMARKQGLLATNTMGDGGLQDTIDTGRLVMQLSDDTLTGVAATLP